MDFPLKIQAESAHLTPFTATNPVGHLPFPISFPLDLSFLPLPHFLIMDSEQDALSSSRRERGTQDRGWGEAAGILAQRLKQPLGMESHPHFLSSFLGDNSDG